ncbi:MAG: AzlD domain-containing protein [Rhodospirillaceae bacterium]|jgi:branched-subunit amino acid transport protein|nr:AzlD domain-containing protein [Rhodospirillaceae bacterium]MBT6139168.1 AzlD domain-containing protein [Rhodospirillaceae bacterium]
MSATPSLLTLVLLSAAVTFLWRGLGAALATRIDPNGEAARWVTCVSYAILAALVARMVVLPLGATAEIPLAIRLSALAVGLVVFALPGHRILLAVAAGAGTLYLFG